VFLAPFLPFPPFRSLPPSFLQTFKDWKVNGVIWANHNLRSCVTAMQETCAAIARDQNLLSVEPRVASVKEVFRLQDQPELDAAEKLYLPQKKA